jgi:hypothetical protein
MKKLKDILNEVEGGTLAGHTGGKGGNVDALYAGPFRSDINDLYKSLEIQLRDRKIKRRNMEKVLGKSEVGDELPIGGFFDIETKELMDTYDILLATSEERYELNKDMTPEQDYDWTRAEFKNEIDDLKKLTKDREDKKVIYKNLTDDFEQIDKDYRYDKSGIEDKSHFINDTNSWKSIYKNNLENVNEI